MKKVFDKLFKILIIKNVRRGILSASSLVLLVLVAVLAYMIAPGVFESKKGGFTLEITPPSHLIPEKTLPPSPTHTEQNPIEIPETVPGAADTHTGIYYIDNMHENTINLVSSSGNTSFMNGKECILSGKSIDNRAMFLVTSDKDLHYYDGYQSLYLIGGVEKAFMSGDGRYIYYIDTGNILYRYSVLNRENYFVTVIENSRLINSAAVSRSGNLFAYTLSDGYMANSIEAIEIRDDETDIFTCSGFSSVSAISDTGMIYGYGIGEENFQYIKNENIKIISSNKKEAAGNLYFNNKCDQAIYFSGDRCTLIDNKGEETIMYEIGALSVNIPEYLITEMGTNTYYVNLSDLAGIYATGDDGTYQINADMAGVTRISDHEINFVKDSQKVYVIADDTLYIYKNMIYLENNEASSAFHITGNNAKEILFVTEDERVCYESASNEIMVWNNTGYTDSLGTSDEIKDMEYISVHSVLSIPTYSIIYYIKEDAGLMSWNSNGKFDNVLYGKDFIIKDTPVGIYYGTVSKDTYDHYDSEGNPVTNTTTYETVYITFKTGKSECIGNRKYSTSVIHSKQINSGG